MSLNVTTVTQNLEKYKVDVEDYLAENKDPSERSSKQVTVEVWVQIWAHGIVNVNMLDWVSMHILDRVELGFP